MVANNGNHEGLFRAAFMQSGSPVPVADIESGQVYYNNIVANSGCSKAPDTLECLRTVDYKVLKAAVNSTSAQFRNYLKTVFLAPGTPDSDIDGILQHYTDDVTQGSPFGTSLLNAVTPQYKRIAAFMGDGVFQAPRRFFLDHLSAKQDSWAFLSKRLKGTVFIGSENALQAHGTDLANVYSIGGIGGMADYLIRFATNLDPNAASGLQWPKYDTKTRKLLTFNDNLLKRQTITVDDYRTAPMKFLTNVTLRHPI
ncbi:hypothetical protein C0991_002898 [Blastosporella zonata]|nr:hypothetical protein C0991_002898 [Blastosporella zonata]